MVANAVEAADVAADEPRGRVGLGAAFLEEHAIAQLLGAPDLRLGRRQADVERADRRERRAARQFARLTTRATRARPRAGGIVPMSAPSKSPSNPLDSPSDQIFFVARIYDSGVARRRSAPRADPRSSRRAAQFDRLGEERVEPRRRRGAAVLVEALAVSATIAARRAVRPPRRMRRAASRPSTPGILMSISTTSKRGVAPRAAARETRRLFAVVRPLDLEAEAAQRLLRDEGVDVVVFGEQRAPSRSRLRRMVRRAAAARGIRWRAARRANAREPA